jgi:uncharacterized protein YidB (DUF937 family)
MCLTASRTARAARLSPRAVVAAVCRRSSWRCWGFLPKGLQGPRGQTSAAPGRTAPVPPGESTSASGPGGGLGDILGGLFGGRSDAGSGRSGGSLNDLLRGGLGGLLGGAAAGSVLSGGLGNLIRDLQKSGHGDAAQSWVRPGPNQEIAPNDLAEALGSQRSTR